MQIASTQSRKGCDFDALQKPPTGTLKRLFVVGDSVSLQFYRSWCLSQAVRKTHAPHEVEYKDGNPLFRYKKNLPAEGVPPWGSHSSPYFDECWFEPLRFGCVEHESAVDDCQKELYSAIDEFTEIKATEKLYTDFLQKFEPSAFDVIIFNAIYSKFPLMLQGLHWLRESTMPEYTNFLKTVAEQTVRLTNSTFIFRDTTALLRHAYTCKTVCGSPEWDPCHLPKSWAMTNPRVQQANDISRSVFSDKSRFSFLSVYWATYSSPKGSSPSSKSRDYRHFEDWVIDNSHPDIEDAVCRAIQRKSIS